MDSASSHASVLKTFFFFCPDISFDGVSPADPSGEAPTRPALGPQRHCFPARRLHQQPADMTNMLQSARSLAHSLTHSFILPPSLPPSAPPQPYPSLHPYLALYLPAACLSRPLGPSHFHSYNALFCFHASRMEGGGGGDGWKDDFTHSTTALEERRGGRGRRCSSILEDHIQLRTENTHTHKEHPHCVIH